MITKDIPLPRLLNAAGGTERRIRPNRVTVNLNITPLSYATIELPAGESLPARGYVEIYTCMGSAGIYRVRSPQDAYGDDITTAELEHAIVEVGDYVIQGDIDQMMAAGSAMQAVFGHYTNGHASGVTPRWQLGSVSAMGSTQIAVKQKYTRVLEAMIALLEQVPGCMMSFDFSTTPWTVNIVSRGTTVAAEGRLSRNVNSARVIYDDTELCTRVYYEVPATTDAPTAYFPVFDANKVYSAGSLVVNSNKLYSLPNGHSYGVTWANTTKEAVANYPTTAMTHMDADTISTYGVIEREVPTGSDYTLAECTRIATEYLNKHKVPRVSIEISAEELSSATGESLDTFTIGKLFRLALPDYNLTVEKNVTALSWSNVYDDPANITVNLAEEEDTAITFLHDLDAKGGGGGGGGAKKQQEEQFKEYQTWFQKTDMFLDLWARHYKSVDEVLEQAGLYIDATGVLIYADDYANSWGSKLNVEANKISLVVSGSGSNAKIKSAEIVAAINESGSSVTINANKIYLLAETIANTITADYISTQLASLALINAQAIAVTGGISCGGNITCAGQLGGNTVYQNGSRMNVIDASVSNDGKTLTLTRASGGNVNFTSGGTFDDGWNACRDAASGSTVLTGYTTLASGRAVELFLDGTNSVGTHVWRYGGTTGTRYTLPSPRP